MKRIGTIGVAVLVGLAFMITTAVAAEQKQSGFLKGYYEKLKEGPEGGAKQRWLKPGVDFSKYKKLMIDSVTFYPAQDQKNIAISGEQIKELTEAFNDAMVTTMNNAYPLVSEPGPDVMRVRMAVTNIKTSNPVIGAVSSVMPPALAISIVKKGATGSWTGSGSISAESMVMDSVSGEVIAAAVDTQSAGFTERYSKLGSAKDAFMFWAVRIKTSLDEMHGVKPKK